MVLKAPTSKDARQVEDARIRKSKEKLRAAMRSLAEETAFADISITALCKRAGVSRQTFYRSYNHVEDVLLDELDEMLSTTFSEESGALFEGIIMRMVTEMERNHSFVRLLFSANIDQHIIAHFERYLERTTVGFEAIRDLHYLNSFVAGGTYQLLKKWALFEPDKSARSMMVSYFRITAPLIESFIVDYETNVLGTRPATGNGSAPVSGNKKENPV